MKTFEEFAPVVGHTILQLSRRNQDVLGCNCAAVPPVPIEKVKPLYDAAVPPSTIPLAPVVVMLAPVVMSFGPGGTEPGELATQ